MNKWWAIFFTVYMIVLASIESFQARLTIAVVVGTGMLIHGLLTRPSRR